MLHTIQGVKTEVVDTLVSCSMVISIHNFQSLPICITIILKLSPHIEYLVLSGS